MVFDDSISQSSIRASTVIVPFLFSDEITRNTFLPENRNNKEPDLKYGPGSPASKASINSEFVFQFQSIDQ
jgi:hypothetical protein